MPAQSIHPPTPAASAPMVQAHDHAFEQFGSLANAPAADYSDSDSDSHSDSDSDSDSLDSQASRKRRKTSPAHGADEKVSDSDSDSDDDDDGPRVPIPISSLPSRIRTNAKSKAKDGPTPQANMGSILAPVDHQATFASLNVKPWLVNSLASMAIRRPTGIQKGCIPEILKGRDCIGGSRTGSGKTVAFAAPILQKWAEDPVGIFALVLTPTRELALQIFEQFKAISSPHALKAVLITGGSDMRPQATALAQRPHVVIATPGRLADHIRTSGEDTICALRRVRMVVLDEADRLLAGGAVGSMLPDVEECLMILPPPAKRQTLLFTATVTPEVRALKERPQTPGRPPVFVCEVDTEKLAIPASLNQMHLQVPVTHREHYLHMLLLTDRNLPKSVIIFCNRTSTADFLTHLLRLLEHRVTALHSKLPQRQRIDNLGRFRASAARILVATDVAARGLDIPEVGLVVNYDIPRDPDDYIHRVGRTARAGRKGESVTFVGQRDVQLVQAIEARVGRQMEAWEEEGVNLETRVIREALKLVGETKREAMLEIEEGREVGGKRKRGMKKL
ncbi:putative ATP-dependent RNA helicase dbp8 [Venustampulla echinocandica]|uniref:Putative ATP-dependent RNA helicase dbp8 n=1 Tax=Venustampulla echinocandica TaxID=2656787 RepID=A0A370TCZ1_9HELO|nr:putative ATP-dependent RNA helicase dbp8 [Venustampulla echinocandica]RDL32106.1 putative ATP-dependent RNA helicase dbp8 [Venustampulla echinocandica]